jgi:hypothetical protein
MKCSLVIVSMAALAAAVGAPSSSFAQNASTTSGMVLPDMPIQSVILQLTPAPVSARELFALNGRYLHPSQVEPYGVVDQNNVRETIYKDPMHCPMAGLLTPGQMNAAIQACSDYFYHVDHSG